MRRRRFVLVGDRQRRRRRRRGLRGVVRTIELFAANDLGDLLPAQRLVFEQRFGEALMLLGLFGQDLLGPAIALVDQALHFGVDLLRRSFGDVLGARDLHAEEHLVIVVAVGDEAELV